MATTLLEEPAKECPSTDTNMSSRQQYSDQSRRPSARQLANVTRNYAGRIDECEAKRHLTEQRLRRSYTKRRGNRTGDYQDQQVQFSNRLKAARLESLWKQYASLHPGADFTHELPFLGWAHTTGVYPHGRDALSEDWANAGTGQPAPDRRENRRHQYRRQPTSPLRTRSSNPPTGSQNSPSSQPKAAPPEDKKAPVNTRNWVLTALIAGAAIIATAAMVINP